MAPDPARRAALRRDALRSLRRWARLSRRGAWGTCTEGANLQALLTDLRGLDRAEAARIDARWSRLCTLLYTRRVSISC